MKNGSILRSYDKKAIPIEVDSGPTTPMMNLSAGSKIFTNENLRNVYILDKNNNRILVYKKNPFESTKQLVYDRIYQPDSGEIRDFWVDNEEVNLYYIDDQNVYEFSLTPSSALVPQNVQVTTGSVQSN